DYIMVVLQTEFYCVKCGKIYTNTDYKWCKPCQTNNLRINFKKWTSGDEKIDNFIQEKQLEIDNYDDIVFEWIPYNQFNYIEKISTKYNFFTVYSAKWKDGPLEYNASIKKYERNSNREIVLKCFYKIQNINEFLNEV